MSATLASASETVQSAVTAATDALSSAIQTNRTEDPVTGSKDKVKSPTEEKLEGFFAHNRPDKKELQDKGILKGQSRRPPHPSVQSGTRAQVHVLTNQS